MKITIITGVLNCAGYIGACMRSVQAQDYEDLEHIIIDGGSSDGTMKVIKTYKSCTTYVLSEPDCSIYEALNKGLTVATGDLIGFLNADDMLAAPDVLSIISNRFKAGDCDAVYGHLDFIPRHGEGLLKRKWKSGPYSRKCLEKGWMPPHPAFYVKKTALGGNISYSQDYGTCGDYDFMLQLLYGKQIRAVFVDRLIVLMRSGGMSNGSPGNIFKAWFYDHRILVKNGIPNPVRAVFLKKIRKLKQFRFVSL